MVLRVVRHHHYLCQSRAALSHRPRQQLAERRLILVHRQVAPKPVVLNQVAVLEHPEAAQEPQTAERQQVMRLERPAQAATKPREAHPPAASPQAQRAAVAMAQDREPLATRTVAAFPSRW